VRIFLALLIGIGLGVAGLWYYSSSHGKATVQSAGSQIEDAAKSAGDSIQQKIHDLNLDPQRIKDELARTGQVVRRKAEQAGQAISDATADARITTAVKARLIASRDLPGLSISVNTTGGVVTLSGAVDSVDQISKAMVLTLESDGVHQVISTLQVRARKQAETPAPAAQ